MKKMSCNLWLTSVTILVAFSSLPVHGEKQAFRCPDNPTSCLCAPDFPNHFTLDCSTEGYQGSISITVMDNQYQKVSITCAGSINPQDYAILPKLSNINIQSLEFRSCPLPSVSFINTMETMDLKPSNLRALMFSTSKNISHFNKTHLKGLEGLTRLTIQGNTVVDFPENFFEGMNNLSWIALQTSSIRLHPNLFKSLPKLMTLEMGRNDFQQLPAGIFKHLSSLINLNLWGCKLSNLTSEVFIGLEKLESLDLSSNELEILPADLFRNVPKLRILNLTGNKFTHLPENLFSTSSNLEELRLNNNKNVIESLPEYFLSNLTSLSDISLSSNNIHHVPETIFEGSNQIKNIDLKNNLIEKIPENLFSDQENMLNLNLESNHISHIDDRAFKNLKNLKSLNLKHNRVANITRLIFNSLNSITEIILRHNNIDNIDDDAFYSQPPLETLDLSYNHISLIGGSFVYNSPNYERRSPFQNLAALKNLNLSHNSITEIFEDWRLNLNLENLDLSFNNIFRLEFNDIHFLTTNINIDLRNNNISEIDFKKANALIDAQDPNISKYIKQKPPVTVWIQNNPLNCDCTLYDFYLYLKDEKSEVKKTVKVFTGDSMCFSPEALTGSRLIDLKPEQLVCPYDNLKTSKPLCPKNCTCDVRPYDRSLLANCTASYPTIPFMLPNIEGQLDFVEFHYENNSLERLSDLFKNRNQLSQIKRLYLSGNNITTITANDIPSHIEILDLRDNQLSHMNLSVSNALSNSTTLEKIYLSGNLIACDCENIHFISFIRENFKKIKDFPLIKCSDGTLLNTKLDKNLCGTPPAVIASSISLAIAGILLGILAALYYKYQQEIKVWMYAKGLCLWFITETEIDKDKIYDAFISFSHKDEDFVINKLLPELEEGPNPFKICLHLRDWTVGEFIPTQIMRSVQDSRRTLVVLSPNFIKSVWGIMEFRVAHKRALEEGRARVIIVLYGDIGPTDDLDPELKMYLSLNTYVKWGDPLFWSKIRYALPHRQKNGTLMPTHNGWGRKNIDDKQELFSSTTPGTPLGQNTPPAHQAHTNPLMNHVNSIPNGKYVYNNETITMSGLKVNGNAKHSDV